MQSQEKPYWERQSDIVAEEPYVAEFLPTDRVYETVLDLGCGSGRSTLPLARVGKTVYGVDGSENQIALLKSKNIPNVIATVGDVGKLPYDDGMFDLIVSLSVVEHIPRADLAGMFAEAKRVLKPDGLFMVRNDAWFYHVLETTRIRPTMVGIAPDPTHITMMRGNEFAKRLENAGFKIIREDHFPFYRYEKKYGFKFPKWFARFFATHNNFVCAIKQ